MPGELITSVQLSDAAATPVDSLWKDTLHHRRLPGEGDIDLIGIVQTLRATGGLNWVGPEVLSRERYYLGEDEALRQAITATERLLAARD